MNRTKELQKLAHQYIPGGAHTYSRGDDQFPLNAPAVLEKGKGCHVWDADANKFLDYGMALRSVTLGYDDERVTNAAIAEIKKGNNLTRASATEVRAAELLCHLVPCADQVKFTKNGSVATTAAVKLARAYTGKKVIARCLQHPFFSYDDWFMGDTDLSRGVPKEVSQLTANFNYNDIESLRQVFERYPNQVAGVILEPATVQHPAVGPSGKNFLQEVRELCTQQKAVFILDEMITGFRWQLEGASHYYKVIPDLATFGKAMGNGFSVAALVGKKEIMSLGGLDHKEERTFLISTTHGAEMCGLGAFIEVMKIYKEENVISHLWKYGEKLIKGFNESAKRHGIQDYVKMEGIECSPFFTTLDRDKKGSAGFRTLFIQELLKSSILMPWVALSLRHGEKELNETLVAVDKAHLTYQKALENGLEKFLEGRAIKPVFRKFN